MEKAGRAASEVTGARAALTDAEPRGTADGDAHPCQHHRRRQNRRGASHRGRAVLAALLPRCARSKVTPGVTSIRILIRTLTYNSWDTLGTEPVK